MNQRGLDQDGLIMREGSLAPVPATFAPVVDAARRQLTVAFDQRRLHSAYLYGSIPRGTAIPGVSDLDLMLALHHEPAPADRADADAIEAALDLAFAQIDGVGIGLCRASTLLSELERHDLGLALDSWRERAARAAIGAERKSLGRTAARRIVRTGFTLVMPRWNGWTSDLATSAEVFGHYYAGRAGQMRTAAATARTPTADPAVLRMLIDDLGPWLAAEYTATHGRKAPRPPDRLSHPPDRLPDPPEGLP